MRNFFIVAALLLFQCSLFCQEREKMLLDSVSDIKVTSLKYGLFTTEKCSDTTKLPFNKISFHDVRYDTSFITLDWQSSTAFTGDYNNKYTLNGGVAKSLTDYISYYYTDNFSTDSAAELICYIKKFTIKSNDSLPSTPFQKFAVANIEIEAFYKKADTLFPAFRIDTAYAYDPEKIKKDFPLVVKELIAPLFQKISKMDTGRVTKRKAYTQDQVTQRYQARFNIPILTASTYNKGIYKTFAEFKNNAPSIPVFIYKKEMLYDSSGTIMNVLNIFGFCDGQTCWILRAAAGRILNKTNEELTPQATQASNSGTLLATPFGAIETLPQSKRPHYDRALLSRVGNSFELEFLMPFLNNKGQTSFYPLLFSLNMETGKIE
jgi:hypothetical protein